MLVTERPAPVRRWESFALEQARPTNCHRKNGHCQPVMGSPWVQLPRQRKLIDQGNTPSDTPRPRRPCDSGGTVVHGKLREVHGPCRCLYTSSLSCLCLDRQMEYNISTAGGSCVPEHTGNVGQCQDKYVVFRRARPPYACCGRYTCGKWRAGRRSFPQWRYRWVCRACVFCWFYLGLALSAYQNVQATVTRRGERAAVQQHITTRPPPHTASVNAKRRGHIDRHVRGNTVPRTVGTQGTAKAGPPLATRR